MRHWLIWTMVASGAVISTGCKGKNDSTASAENQPSAPVESSAVTTATSVQNSPTNPPPTFDPNAKAESKSDATDNSSPGFTKNGAYVVQVLVFQTRSRAEALATRLKSSGLPAYVVEVENPTSDLSGAFYRVRIGNFATREAAGDFGKTSLKPQGFDYWVDAKANDHVGVAAPPIPSHAVSKPVPTASTPASTLPATPSKTARVPSAPPASSLSSKRIPVKPLVPVPSGSEDSMPASSKHAGSSGVQPVSSSSATKPATVPSTAVPAPASTESDSMGSPFSEEDYYRPADSLSDSSNPKDAPVNSHRTLPTW